MEIKISEELKQKLEGKIKETNFESLQEYILFILEQITSETETERQTYTKEEEADIKGGSEIVKVPPTYTNEEEGALKKKLDDITCNSVIKENMVEILSSFELQIWL